MIIGAHHDERMMIIQPYIPAYRVPLFFQLRTDLARQGIGLAVAAAEASGSDQMRHDDLTLSVADYLLPEHGIQVGSRKINSRDLKVALDDFQPTLVVVEQAVKNLETWRLLLQRSSHRPRVAMWGQGRSYSTNPSRVESAVKKWLTRRADWFFAYTEEGAAYVTSRGFDSDRVTVLQNAIDSRALRDELQALDHETCQAFREEHGLTKGKVGLFLGGVDEKKGIPFLLDSAREVGRRIPDFKLVVGGAGSMVEEVQSRQAHGEPIVYLGRLDGSRKALALACADVMLVPEWVGLVAVDSLAACVPVVTTHHPSHSPEFAYLTEGETSVVTEHDVSIYAEAVSALLDAPERLDRMGAAARGRGAGLTIEEMSRRFASGILAWAGAR